MRDGGLAKTVERVRALISRSGLTLYQISKQTRLRPFDGQHQWLIPETFYQLIGRGQIPHICQIVALSQITGIDVYTWLKVFGYDLEDLLRLQATIHQDRTVILATRVYDSDATIELPTHVHCGVNLSRSEFVSEIVSRLETVRASELVTRSAKYLYLKVGKHDTRLLPKVVPGTIVRINCDETSPTALPGKVKSRQRPIFAVAHLGGLAITYVDWIDEKRIALLSRCHCHPALVCSLNEEAVVLGRVDAELRPLTTHYEHVARRGHDHSPARLTQADGSVPDFGRLLRSSRERIGLTFREAHELSLRVAREQRDAAHGIALGSLSEWEANAKLPTQLPQLISLCAMYCLDLGAVLAAAGVCADSFAFQLPGIPDAPIVETEPGLARLESLATMLAHVRHALPLLTGRDQFCWEDVLWWGRGEPALDTDLDGALFVFVNRRERRIAEPSSTLMIDRPLFALRAPSIGCFCGRCFVDGESLYIQPEPHFNVPIKRLSRRDVEVVGRATAVMRMRC